MSIVITCFVAGIVLLALEILVPGAILGIFGAICMIVGVVAAFVSLGAMGGLVATGIACVLLAVVVYLEFVWLPRSRLARSFTMDTTNAATSQPPPAVPEDVIGREGTAETALAPGGFVIVDGSRYEARSQDGYVAAGARIKVVDIDTFRLIVRKL